MSTKKTARRRRIRKEKGWIRDRNLKWHEPGTPGFAAALSYQQSCLRQQNLPSPVTYPVNPATLQSYQQPVDLFGNFSTQGLGLTSAFGYPQYPPIQNFQQPAAHPGNLGLASTGPHALSGVQQQYVPGIQQLPPSGHYQPAFGGHHQPPVAAHHQPPVAAHHQPPVAAHHQPPVTDHQPPVADHQPLTANPQESVATLGALSVPTKALPSLSVSHQQSGIAAHPEPEIRTHRQPSTENAQQCAAWFGPPSVPRKPSPPLSLSTQQSGIAAYREPEIRTHRQPSTENAQQYTAWFGPPSVPRKPSPPLSLSTQQSSIAAYREPQIRTHRQPPNENTQQYTAWFGLPSIPKKPSPSLSPSHQPTIVEAHAERGIRTHPQHPTNNTQRSAAFYGPPHPLTIREALVEISGNARQSSSHDSSSPITSSEQSRERNHPGSKEAIDVNTSLLTREASQSLESPQTLSYRPQFHLRDLIALGQFTGGSLDPDWEYIREEYFPTHTKEDIIKVFYAREPPLDRMKRETLLEMISSNVRMESWLMKTKFFFMGSPFNFALQLPGSPFEPCCSSRVWVVLLRISRKLKTIRQLEQYIRRSLDVLRSYASQVSIDPKRIVVLIRIGCPATDPLERRGEPHAEIMRMICWTTAPVNLVMAEIDNFTLHLTGLVRLLSTLPPKRVFFTILKAQTACWQDVSITAFLRVYGAVSKNINMQLTDVEMHAAIFLEDLNNIAMVKHQRKDIGSLNSDAAIASRNRHRFALPGLPGLACHICSFRAATHTTLKDHFDEVHWKLPRRSGLCRKCGQFVRHMTEHEEQHMHHEQANQLSKLLIDFFDRQKRTSA